MAVLRVFGKFESSAGCFVEEKRRRGMVVVESEGSDAEEEPSTTPPSGQAARQKLVRTLVSGANNTSTC